MGQRPLPSGEGYSDSGVPLHPSSALENGRQASNLVRASKGLFLLAAGLSFLISVSLWFLVDREQGLFVGLWVPSILSLGALLLGGKDNR